MKLPYAMVIQWSDEDQVYVVSLPEFGPYALTHGSTHEKAAKQGREVLELLVEDYEAREWKLPEPQKFGKPVSVVPVKRKRAARRRQAV